MAWSNVTTTSSQSVDEDQHQTRFQYGNEASNWTEMEKREYLTKLSLQSWNNRKPVVIYLSLLSVIGFAGNTLSFVVYHRRYRPSSTRVFVLSMSLCDLLINVLGIPLQTTTIRYAYNAFDTSVCRMFYVFALVPSQASGLFKVLVSYDRYRHICHPFGKQLTAGQTWRLVGGASGVALLLFLPFTPFYGWHSVDSPVPGVKAVMCWIHDPFRQTPYPLLYNAATGLSMAAGLFFICVFYIRIGIYVFRNQMSMKKVFSRAKVNDNTLHSTPSISRSSEVTRSKDGRNEAILRTSRSAHLSTSTQPNTPSAPDGRKENAPYTLNNSCSSFADSRPETQIDTVHTPDVSFNSLGSQFSRQEGSGARQADAHDKARSRILSNKPANMCDNLTDCGYNVYGLCMRSYFINSAANAFIYCICNPKFRQQCRLLLTRKARM